MECLKGKYEHKGTWRPCEPSLEETSQQHEIIFTHQII